jgi:hypothetical protein
MLLYRDMNGSGSGDRANEKMFGLASDEIFITSDYLSANEANVYFYNKSETETQPKIYIREYKVITTWEKNAEGKYEQKINYEGSRITKSYEYIGINLFSNFIEGLNGTPVDLKTALEDKLLFKPSSITGGTKRKRSRRIRLSRKRRSMRIRSRSMRSRSIRLSRKRRSMRIRSRSMRSRSIRKRSRSIRSRSIRSRSMRSRRRSHNIWNF